MKGVDDLMRYGTSAKVLKEGATVRKRAAGLIRTAIECDSKLTIPERETLTKAVALLGKMAEVYECASREAKARDRRQAELVAEARKAVDVASADVNSILDRLVFVVAVKSSPVKWIRQLPDLERAFIESKDACARNIATDPAGLKESLRRAWDKLEFMRPMLRTRYTEFAKALEAGKTPIPPT